MAVINKLILFCTTTLLIFAPTQVSGQGWHEARLDQYLQRKARRMGLVGMQAGFLTDSYIWQGNYGLKELKTNENVDKHTLFMIASCSKPVTALGILKLQEMGKLNGCFL